jgi:DNA polymerase III delta prime subunit
MSDLFVFEPATKAQAKARIALAGPSGSGKTWTALALATELGSSIAVIDTERGSASKYAGPFAFERLNMQRYDPRDLPKALAAAAARGFEVIIVDSLSKFWAGQGGMLEQVDNAAKRSYGNNSFGGWKEARPMETAMIEALLSYPGHVIVTMRTKTAYEIIEDDRGRKVPTKIGLKPEQRDGIEYEFDIVGDMDLENTLTVSKSRCAELSGEVIRQPGADLAKVILSWLTDGVAVLSARDYQEQALDESATYLGLRDLYKTVKAAGLLGAAVTNADGEPLSLEQLIISRGKEAEAAEVFRTQQAAAEPAPPASEVPQEPESGPEPAAASTEPAAPAESVPDGSTDLAWMTQVAENLLPNARTRRELAAVRANVAERVTAGDCTPEDAERLGQLIGQREAEMGIGRKPAAA